MIRPFDWRDLPLLHRVRHRGLCLDSQLAYTRGPNVLQYALLDMLNPGRTAHTFVARPSGQASIGQVLLPPGRSGAHIAFISPAETLDDGHGAEMLDAMARAGAEAGAHSLIAEVDERTPTFESLRRFGFAIYSRQRIWRLASEAVPNAPAVEPASEDGLPLWRSATQADELAISSLYLNLVPPLVQQVEPPPTRHSRDLVHWRQGELLGYLSFDGGPRGVWVQPYFHPGAEDPDRLLGVLLSDLEDLRQRPLYVCVRSYQSWMTAPLNDLGFEALADQAVMVKRLAVSLRQSQPAVLPALEGTLPKPTAPFARIERDARPTVEGRP
ncbi:MAG: hypothetical protein IMZ44_24105 [Planctomycetes bacterium]|nr:hypothetical protein [Planctomycetota bacterium]